MNSAVAEDDAVPAALVRLTESPERVPEVPPAPKLALAPPAWLAGGRIPSLDGLRALAVLAVVGVHATQTRGFPDVPVLRAVCSVGGVGVDVFFVISGFLITTLMARELDRTGRLSVGRFYVRRLLRIVPVYACFLLAVALLQAAGAAYVSGRDWVAALTYTMNFVHRPSWEVGHAWSLSIEEHFYLAWPFAVALCAAATCRRVALACVVFCFGARWFVMLAFPAYTPMAELWTFTRLDTIAVGCLLAFLVREPAWQARLDRLVSRNTVVLAAVLAFAASLALTRVSAMYSVGIGFAAHAVLIGLLLWAAVRRPESAVGRVLNHRVAVWVGLASYSLYLWQQLFLNRTRDDLICSFPLNVFLAFAAAALSYRLIERPFLRIKDRAASAK
jgi:peptidoglycan/LPS O-acetylase OafA/YrhL